MRPDGFTLAATTNDLERESRVRDVADVLEFRMDKAEDPMAQLRNYAGDLPLVATNRPEWCGGQAPEDGRIERLLAASEFDAVGLVDVELETAREDAELVPAFRENGADVVVSYHEFEATPDREVLDATFERCSELGDVAKVATYATEYADALCMLAAVHDATQEGRQVAGISMGEIGSHTRVVAPLYGSKLGYAPLESDPSEYAPGQLPIHELASMIETLTGTGTRPAARSPTGTSRK